MSVPAERLYGLPRQAIARIRDVLDGHPVILGCVLYGSRAMGNYRTGSDIDLCLDAPTMSLSELLKIENEIDDLLLPWKVDLTVDRVPGRGVRSVSRSGRRVIVSGLAGARVRLRPQAD